MGKAKTHSSPEAIQYALDFKSLRDMAYQQAQAGDALEDQARYALANIVGFPEETDQDFEDTLNLIREVQYGQAFSFKYSTRPGTPAAERDQLPEDIKTERLHRLQALITEQQRTIQDSMVGREVSVLFERNGRFEEQMVGKSEYLHAVHVSDPTIQIGDIRRVRITQSNPNSLDGQALN